MCFECFCCNCRFADHPFNWNPEASIACIYKFEFYILSTFSYQYNFILCYIQDIFSVDEHIYCITMSTLAVLLLYLFCVAIPFLMSASWVLYWAITAMWTSLLWGRITVIVYNATLTWVHVAVLLRDQIVEAGFILVDGE